ncbi:hypothetical protein Scep_027798 [Stephania cephalantha]|uniref:Uncharacterized protein n=1 Tax=Stephania cephalantha TaxID=152367 RepID=A0AAP0E8Q1_9MAGN
MFNRSDNAPPRRCRCRADATAEIAPSPQSQPSPLAAVATHRCRLADAAAAAAPSSLPALPRHSGSAAERRCLSLLPSLSSFLLVVRGIGLRRAALSAAGATVAPLPARRYRLRVVPPLPIHVWPFASPHEPLSAAGYCCPCWRPLLASLVVHCHRSLVVRCSIAAAARWPSVAPPPPLSLSLADLPLSLCRCLLSLSFLSSLPSFLSLSSSLKENNFFFLILEKKTK